MIILVYFKSPYCPTLQYETIRAFILIIILAKRFLFRKADFRFLVVGALLVKNLFYLNSPAGAPQCVGIPIYPISKVEIIPRNITAYHWCCSELEKSD